MTVQPSTSASRRAQEEALLELLLATSSLGVALFDRKLRYVRVNEALAALNRRPVEDHIGRTIHDVLGDPPPQLIELLHGVLETGEAVIDAELSMPDPRAGTRHFVFSCHPSREADGGIIGIACFVAETTDARTAEAALVASQRQLELAMRAGRLGTWHWDLATRRMTWSPMLEELHGFTPGSFDGSIEAFRARLHRDDAKRVVTALQQALAGAEQEVEYRIVRPDGEVRWMSARGEVSRDASGEPLAISGVCSDTTDRKRVELEREFHMRVGETLGTAVDVPHTLEAIAHLSVPELADVALVELFEQGEVVTASAATHRDPAAKPLVDALLDGRHPAAPIVRLVLDSRTPVLLERVGEGELSRLATSTEQQDVLRRLAPRSWLVVPISSRGQGIGVLSLGLLDGSREFRPDIRTLAEELARRGAAVLEKAVIYRAQRSARRAAEVASMRLHQLQRATAALSHASTPEEVVRVVVRQAMAATGAISAWVALPVAGEALEVHEIGGPLDARQVDLLGGEAAPMRESASVRAPVVVRSLSEWRQRYPESSAQAAALGLRSLIALPLLSGDEVRGALSVGFSEEGRHDEDVRVLLLALAREAAGALDRALLFKSERDARARAERADRAKAEFLATMSHELRTPLSAILGFTSLLIDEVTGPITPAQRKQLARVEASARHLLALIEEVLSYGRLEAGREQAWISEVDLAALTREAASMVEPIATTQGLELICEIPDALVARTDQRMVRQILLNLLGNAVRYTPQGTVRITLRTEGNQAIWDVIDTGIGIAPEHQERIFTPFYQIDQTHTRRYGGTGLGLSVSRRLAQLLGGDVRVRSALRQGSVFTVRVPLGVVTPDPALAPEHSAR